MNQTIGCSVDAIELKGVEWKMRETAEIKIRKLNKLTKVGEAISFDGHRVIDLKFIKILFFYLAAFFNRKLTKICLIGFFKLSQPKSKDV